MFEYHGEEDGDLPEARGGPRRGEHAPHEHEEREDDRDERGLVQVISHHQREHERLPVRRDQVHHLNHEEQQRRHLAPELRGLLRLQRVLRRERRRARRERAADADAETRRVDPRVRRLLAPVLRARSTSPWRVRRHGQNHFELAGAGTCVALVLRTACSFVPT